VKAVNDFLTMPCSRYEAYLIITFFISAIISWDLFVMTAMTEGMNNRMGIHMEATHHTIGILQKELGARIEDSDSKAIRAQQRTDLIFSKLIKRMEP